MGGMRSQVVILIKGLDYPEVCCGKYVSIQPTISMILNIFKFVPKLQDLLLTSSTAYVLEL